MVNPQSALFLVCNSDGGTKKWKEKSVFWSEYNVPDGCLSIPSLVERRGTELKQTYINKINKLGLKNKDGKSIIQLMTFSGFSFWHASLLDQKSIWKTDSIYLYFKLMVLESLIEESNATELHLIDIDSALLPILSALADSKGCKVKIVSSILSKEPKKQIKSDFKQWLRSLGYWLRECWRYRRAMLRKPSLISSAEVNIVGYTSGFTWPKTEMENPDSIYWSGLQKILEGKKVSWSLNYVPDAQHPQFSQWLANKSRHSNNHPHKVSAVEEQYSLAVMLRALVLYCKLAWRSQKLTHVVLASALEREVWLRDWKESFIGFESIRNCLKFELLREVAKRHSSSNVQCKTLYVYENQPWELMLQHHWRTFELGSLYAFQHAGGKFFDMRPYASNSSPLPDLLIATGEGARSELEQFDYPKSRITVAEAIRNLYLADITLSPPLESAGKELLVITDYLLEATVQQLTLLSEAKEWVEENFDLITIKPHPACNVDSVLKNLGLDRCDKIRVVKSPLNELWSQCSQVYASNLTGAVIEAAYIGKPTIVCLPKDGFNMSPLRGVEGTMFVATKEQLITAFDKMTLTKLGHDYYSLNKSLPQWRNILR